MRKVKKLSIRRETLRALNPDELRRVEGGRDISLGGCVQTVGCRPSGYPFMCAPE